MIETIQEFRRWNAPATIKMIRARMPSWNEFRARILSGLAGTRLSLNARVQLAEKIGRLLARVNMVDAEDGTRYQLGDLLQDYVPKLMPVITKQETYALDNIGGTPPLIARVPCLQPGKIMLQINTKAFPDIIGQLLGFPGRLSLQDLADIAADRIPRC
jgi:hypothetical protein